MELKAPTPLGESKTKKTSPTNIQQNTIKRVEKDQNFFEKILSKFQSIKNRTSSPIEDSELEKTDSEENFKPNGSNFLSRIPKKYYIYIFGVGIPLLLLLILSISIVTYVRSEPYNLANEFLKKVEQKDIQGAYDLTTPTYQVVVSEREFNEVVNRLNSVDISNAKVRKRSIVRTKGMGTYANITYKVSGYNLDLVLFDAEKDWGIHSIEFTLE